ncbi:MAG: hypothetical protein OER22_05735 [Gammaproteobacteria bacterium]|nr:hypothetical protein [Gammaproteobacteria bacterium]MDH3373981.1 hypothetical protein [Gammaproteobacteria bacterium]MDH3552100.1 hypothetical protein [Gammaproteobacteria bacterium]
MGPVDPQFRLGALILIGASLTLSSPAYAYLDPGTGSIILQSILASIAVAIGMLRLYWHRFKSFVANLTGNSQDQKREKNQEVGQEPDL